MTSLVHLPDELLYNIGTYLKRRVLLYGVVSACSKRVFCRWLDPGSMEFTDTPSVEKAPCPGSRGWRVWLRPPTLLGLQPNALEMASWNPDGFSIHGLFPFSVGTKILHAADDDVEDTIELKIWKAAGGAAGERDMVNHHHIESSEIGSFSFSEAGVLAANNKFMLLTTFSDATSRVRNMCLVDCRAGYVVPYLCNFFPGQFKDLASRVIRAKAHCFGNEYDSLWRLVCLCESSTSPRDLVVYFIDFTFETTSQFVQPFHTFKSAHRTRLTLHDTYVPGSGDIFFESTPADVNIMVTFRQGHPEQQYVCRVRRSASAPAFPPNPSHVAMTVLPFRIDEPKGTLVSTEPGVTLFVGQTTPPFKVHYDDGPNIVTYSTPSDPRPSSLSPHTHPRLNPLSFHTRHHLIWTHDHNFKVAIASARLNQPASSTRVRRSIVGSQC